MNKLEAVDKLIKLRERFWESEIDFDTYTDSVLCVLDSIKEEVTVS